MTSDALDSSSQARRSGPAQPQTNPTQRGTRLATISDLAERQLRVVRLDQLHKLGWSRRHIEHEIGVGRWMAVAPCVVAMQNAELTYPQRLWLGVLHASPGGVLSHATACQRGGLEGWDGDLIEVITQKGDLVSGLPGFRFHQSRRGFWLWVHPSRRPPTLIIEAAALLAAERDDNLPRAIGRLAAAVQQRLTTAGRLLAVSRQIPKLRHGRVLRLALGDIAGGAHSFAELRLAELCRAAGVRPPDRQRLRRDATGRRRYLDCEWDLPDGRILVLEIDGSFHLEVRQWSDDMVRERQVALTGRRVLRCSSVELRLEPRGVINDLRAMGVPDA